MRIYSAKQVFDEVVLAQSRHSSFEPIEENRLELVDVHLFVDPYERFPIGCSKGLGEAQRRDAVLLGVVEIKKQLPETIDDGKISLVLVGFFEVGLAVVLNLFVFPVSDSHDVQPKLFNHVQLLNQTIQVTDTAGINQPSVLLLGLYLMSNCPFSARPPQGDLVTRK
jgi:hypothetical protein